MKKLTVICLLMSMVLISSFSVEKKSFAPCQSMYWTGIWCPNSAVAANIYCYIHTHLPPLPPPTPPPGECDYWYTARLKCVEDAVPPSTRCTLHQIPPLAISTEVAKEDRALCTFVTSSGLCLQETVPGTDRCSTHTPPPPPTSPPCMCDYLVTVVGTATIRCGKPCTIGGRCTVHQIPLIHDDHDHLE